MKMRTRKAAAFTAALLIAFTGFGGALNSSVIEERTILTASAASVVTVTNKTLGIDVKYKSAEIVYYESTNGIDPYSGYTNVGIEYAPMGGNFSWRTKYTYPLPWDVFVSGIQFDDEVHAEIVMHYADGDLTINPLTGGILEDTRGYIHLTSQMLGITSDVPGTVAIFSTERNEKGDAYTNVMSISAPDVYAGGSVEVPYVQDTEIFVEVSTMISTGVSRYHLNLNTNTLELVGSRAPVSLSKVTTASVSSFPESAGCSKVTVMLSVDSVNGDTKELENLNASCGTLSRDGLTLTYTGDEWASGLCSFGYPTANSIEADIVVNNCRVRFDFEDGYAEYYMFGSYPVLNDYSKSVPTMKDENGNDVTDGSGNPLVDAKDEEGYPQVSDEYVQSPAQDTEYPVAIYKGASVIKEMTSGEFEKGVYTLYDYDPAYHYYVRVGLDEKGTDAIYYRYDDSKGAWVKRINTKETGVYTAQVNPFTFPGELAEGSVRYLNDSIASWTRGDFGKGITFRMITKECENYEVSFDYGENGSARWTYIGIDPERTESAASGADVPTTNVPVETNPGDTIHVEGTTKDGEHYDFDYTVPEDGNGDLTLPDGDYTITDENTELFDGVTVDSTSDEPQKGADVKNPVEGSRYEVTSPDGSAYAEGEVADGSFDNVSDMGKTRDEVEEDGFYHGFVWEEGTLNSTNPQKHKKEQGYFSVNEDGSLNKAFPENDLKGDVNLDGKVNVADVVMLQKYLLKAESFNLENLVNADVYTDGSGDVFDLAILKRMLLNK